MIKHYLYMLINSKIFRWQKSKFLFIFIIKISLIYHSFSYCAKHFSSEKEDSKDVYLSLLRVYLKPEGGLEPMLQPALTLLNNYYNSIDVPRVNLNSFYKLKL